jgi:hypothetical protein
VPVLGPVVDEEEERRRGQALDEAIEERLGLRVDPVEILDDQQEWLRPRLAQDEVLDRIQYPLSALRRVESLPLRILERHVEKGEQRGKRRLQRTVQGEDPPGELFQDVWQGLIPGLRAVPCAPRGGSSDRPPCIASAGPSRYGARLPHRSSGRRGRG